MKKMRKKEGMRRWKRWKRKFRKTSEDDVRSFQEDEERKVGPDETLVEVWKRPGETVQRHVGQ